VFELISSVLAWFYSFTNNYAFAIGLFTLLVMLLVTPLTLKATKGMLEMQHIQPEVKRIQEQFKGDRQRINEETMALFKEHKVNPLGGCLPMLLQAPIFIVIYQVLNGVTRLCTPGLQAKEICQDLGTFAPDYLDKGSDLYQSLFGKLEMLSFGLDLSKTAASIVRADLVKGIPYVLLVVFVAGLSYFQQWQISSRNTATTINKQQQMIMRVIPAAVGVFQIVIPAGLIFYFLVQSVFRIAQNYYITRRFYGPNATPVRAAATSPKTAVADTKATKTAPKPAPSAKPKPSKRVTPPKGDGGVAGGRPGSRPAPSKPSARPRPSTAKPKPSPKKNP
jgi:YidC/Oxa1 family membrane protein insertase